MRILILMALLFSTSAFAWEKVISCDGDMFVVDRQPNAHGRFDYQAVFRGDLLESMLDQNVIQYRDISENGEVVRPSLVGSGLLSERPHIGFQLTNAYSKAGNHALIFSGRSGELGDYVFHSCWFKYPQP